MESEIGKVSFVAGAKQKAADGRARKVGEAARLPYSRYRFWLGLLALGFALQQTQALAEVSLKSRNFYVTLVDAVFPGTAMIKRTYNSKATLDKPGLFGYGWGSNYETYLKPAGDGSVVVHEYATGAEVRFHEMEPPGMMEQLMGAAKASGQFVTPEAEQSYHKKLEETANYRSLEWDRFSKMGKLETRKLAEGAQLRSPEFPGQALVKTKQGFMRTLGEEGKTEMYNAAGRLEKIEDKNKNAVSFVYKKDGSLDHLIDSQNRKMIFTLNTRGLAVRIDCAGAEVVQYQYNKDGEMISSVDADQHRFAFTYDRAHRHLMTEMTQEVNGRQEKMKVSYYGLEQNEDVRSVRDFSGEMLEYRNLTTKADPLHTVIEVAQTDDLPAEPEVKGKAAKKGKHEPMHVPRAPMITRFEFFMKSRTGGALWTEKSKVTRQGEVTETTFNECCGMPLEIRSGAEVTQFFYDDLQHLVKKVTPSEVVELSYDAAAKKVSKVTKYLKSNPEQKTWSEFEYDDKLNLALAKNSEGHAVKLLYDLHGRISTVVDKEKREIHFRYDENSRPIEISDPATGSLQVSYTNTGKIKSTESREGTKIAQEIRQAFQSLLEIIEPTGVSLGF